jgi:hypothetical protein
MGKLKIAFYACLLKMIFGAAPAGADDEASNVAYVETSKYGRSRLLDCELIFRKPNRCGASNNQLSNGIPRGKSGKFTISAPWRLVSITEL